MVGYRRMGNMGQQHLGNATSAASLLHQQRDLWRSPRGTVLRIEALALVAIFLSFFLAVFGSCRRWSNHWFFQNGFLVANAVFLSLGTYSIGLMQSSPVKSEMYPIWAVSLLALLCCVDSAAASGLDNKSQIWRMLYQICLYFGYVLLMSISTISSDIGNIAICVLSAVTFIKGFHMSMALVLPSSMRNMIREISAYRIKKCSFGDPDEERHLMVDNKLDIMIGHHPVVEMGDIASMRIVQSDLHACKDVCLSFSLSHLLHRRFLGLSSVKPAKASSTELLVKNYEHALNVVEVELAFLYDILYTSNTFLYYYEAKSASIWAFASVISICFVGAVAVMIPRARTNRHASPAGTIFVDTTTADLVITGVILVSLALLQVFQLLCCWTSNWARVALACDYTRNNRRRRRPVNNEEETVLSWGMRLRASLVNMNWFDDQYHLWQNKLGQYSVIDDESTRMPRCQSQYHQLFCCGFLGSFCSWITPCATLRKMCQYLEILVCRCLGLIGIHYISRELKEMLQGCGTESSIDLHPDVKAYIGNFVGSMKRSNEVSDWAYSSVEVSGLLPDFSLEIDVNLPADAMAEMDEMIYLSCILVWHIATCHCELALQHDGNGRRVMDNNKDHRVATDLSKYCAYLVASAPRLLPGRSETTKLVYGLVKEAAVTTRKPAAAAGAGDNLRIAALEDVGPCIYALGVKLGQGLVSMTAADRWKLLAEFWVKALVYAAPSDNVEEHMQHLSQGGELITHLWAMLYHAGIHKWQLNPPQDDIRMGWDYIFRIRSWKDLNRPQPHQGPHVRDVEIEKVRKPLKQRVKDFGKNLREKRKILLGKRHTKGESEGEGDLSQVRTDARADGASSS